MDDERLGDDVFHAVTGIERSERILKDDLHITAQAAHIAAARGQQIAAFKAYAAGRRLDQTQNQSSQRALARDPILPTSPRVSPA